MNELYNILIYQLHCYPAMEAGDILKLIYQNEFGPGHMIISVPDSYQQLKKEYQSIYLRKKIQKEIIQHIGNRMVRFELTAVDESLLPLINDYFSLTAKTHKGSTAFFEAKCSEVRTFLMQLLPQSVIEFDQCLLALRNQNYAPFSHTQTYRSLYAPSYRVMKECYGQFLTLILTIRQLLMKKDKITISIEGNCASGKTTLSALLERYFFCNIIHMDDFFLPPDLRTEERMSLAGGNIHSERFLEEVFIPMTLKQPVTYRRFNCHIMDYQDCITLSDRPVTIVEGSYCMHPKFQSFYDYKVFLHCNHEEQTKRICNRNGEEMLQNFINRWIPMENHYFEAYSIEEKSDISILTD